jgi:hypothetical protein
MATRGQLAAAASQAAAAELAAHLADNDGLDPDELPELAASSEDDDDDDAVDPEPLLSNRTVAGARSMADDEDDFDLRDFDGDVMDLRDEANEGESDEETESDDEPDAEFEFGEGGGYSAPKKRKVKPGQENQNGGLPNFLQGEYDKEYWRCNRVGKDGQFVSMVDTIHTAEYVVPLARVNKALRFLHQPTVTEMLRAAGGQCRCKRNPPCFQGGITTFKILTHRKTYFQQLNERQATKYLADLVRPHNLVPDNHASKEDSWGTPAKEHSKIRKRPRRQAFNWVLEGVQVCEEYFRAVFGISKDKLTSVRVLL